MRLPLSLRRDEYLTIDCGAGNRLSGVLAISCSHETLSALRDYVDLLLCRAERRLPLSLPRRAKNTHEPSCIFFPVYSPRDVRQAPSQFFPCLFPT